MSFADERATIESHFLTGWGTLTPVEIAGVPSQNPPATAYIRLGIRSGTREPASLPAEWIRSNGLVVVDVFAPDGQGSIRDRELADQVASVLDLRQLHSPGVRTIRFGVTSIIEDLNATPGWFRIQCLTPFQHDSYVGPVPGVLTDGSGGTLFGRV